MKLERDDLDWAVQEGLLSEEQSERLWSALKERRAPKERRGQAVKGQSGRTSTASSQLNFASVAYYAGGLVAIAAMTWLLARIASLFDPGPTVLALVAMAYGTAFGVGGWVLRFRKDLRVAGGLLFVVAVAAVPVAVFHLRQGLLELAVGWPAQRGLSEGVATVIAGGIALRYVQFPFLTAPVAAALWWLAEFSLPELLVGGLTWTAHLRVSVAFGGAMLAVAYLVDRRTAADYAFWGYLFGLLAFWGGLIGLLSDTEPGLLLFALVNVALVLVAVFLDRRAFLIFGAIGIFGYLGHLASEVFAGTILFPLALSALGIGLVYLGVKYQRRRAAIERLLRSRLPSSIQRLSPRQR